MPNSEASTYLSGSEKLVSGATQRNVLTCSPDASLIHVTDLMQSHHCSSIVILDDGLPVGIWTEADTLNIDFSDPSQLLEPVSSSMSRALQTILKSCSLDEAALELKHRGIRHLIVLDSDGSLYGILTQSDVINHQDAEFFISMTEVKSVMSADKPPTLDHNTVLNDAVILMKQEKSDALIVTQHNQPVGLLTQRDLVRQIGKGQIDVKLCDIMSKQLIAVPHTMSLLAARSLMQKRHIRHLCVNDHQGNLFGLISFKDILNSIEQAYVRRLRTALASQSADLKSAKQQLHMAHTLIEASMDGIMVTNEDGIIESINPAFSILTGYSEVEALGQTAGLISSGRHDSEFYEDMWRNISLQGFWKGEIWNRRKSGEIYLEWLTITKIIEPQSRRALYAGIFSDITERKKSEQIIENLAYYDALTKLPNRQLLFDRFDVALASAHRDNHKVALLFIDLDHFKRINDTLGHSVGDKVLTEIAARLKRIIREGDTLARIGGDELVLMLTEVTETDTISRAVQRISDCLQESIELEDNNLFVTASMGCSVYPEDGLDREELLKNADIAMYRAKQNGRNNFRFYSSKMDELSHINLKIENRLRIALAKMAFFLEYQPKKSLITDQVLGVEALIRWHDDELGRVPPDQFIPLAEDLGLINEIGAWVLCEATAQSKRWQTEGLPAFQVSVNVSALQFKQHEVINQVEYALSDADLHASFLDLEITETSLLGDMDSVGTSLKYLRDLGLSISLDDFGTGFSSLSMLTQLDIDNLKIDRSFMQGIPGNTEKEVLVSTIILMAHNLGFKVIAEGVETEAQMQFLIEKKCDQMQGYYFSKPVSAGQISELMRNIE